MITVLPYPGGTPRLILTAAGRGEAATRYESFTLCATRGGAPTVAAERLYTDGLLLTEGECYD